MAKDKMDALEWLRKQLLEADPDLLAAMVKVFTEEVMSAEADVLCGADYGERSDERVNRRNGYRARPWDTRAGTIDLAVPGGEAIPIEERCDTEVLFWRNERIAPAGVKACNPAFDVTPHRYVTAIVTEAGIVRPPYEDNLKKLFPSLPAAMPSSRTGGNP